MNFFAVSCNSNNRFTAFVSVTCITAHTFKFAFVIHYVYFSNFYVENFFNCVFYLRFSCASIYFKCIFLIVENTCRFFSYNWALNDVACIHYASTSSTFSTAALVIINLSCLATSSTEILSAGITVMPCKLRADNSTFSLSPATTISALVSTEIFLRKAANSFVLGASKVKPSSTTNFSSFTLEERIDLIAKRRTFLGNLYAYERGVGPNTTPPPRHCGERIEP
ncbi:50S ribosomal protein L4 [Listeria monocytogenes]|nr:50S ribosomal protein L4 [Listeria monocytogenes]GAM96215.1 50S ribosomal protein L4 [Listeria monocytogenes]GAT39630.1 50S ribosomal protein L4 [Listeria monocytogenes]